MIADTRNLYQCQAGHQQYLPYAADSVPTWCEPCRAMTPCAIVRETFQQQLSANVDAMRVIREKFESLATTWDSARRKEPVYLEPDPKTEAEQALVASLTASRFPARHIATLPHMDAGGLSDVRAVLAGLQGPGPSTVILWGDYGTGKTQVATAVAMHRHQKGAPTRYTLAPALMRAIKDNFHTRVPESELLRRYHESPGLVIDEVQAALDESPSEMSWARTQLQGIIDARYSSRRPLKTLLLINAESDDALRKRLGAHILSRVQESGKILRVCRRNYRSCATPNTEALAPADAELNQHPK